MSLPGLPVVFLSACTALSIAGNAAKAFTVTTTSYDITYHLWKANYCVPGVGCGKISHSDLGTGSCDFKNQYRAAQAFGILTCIISGVLWIAALLNCAKAFGPISNRNLQIQTFGALVLIGVQVLMFIIFVTIKNLDCLNTQNPSYDAAPFLYLGGIVVALAYLAWTALTPCHPDSVAESAAVAQPVAQSPTRSITANTMPPPAQTPVHYQPQQSIQQQVVVDDQRSPFQPTSGALESWAARSPQRQEPTPQQQPPLHQQQPRLPTLAATSTEEVAVPDGDDWHFDQSTGLSWSETAKLFFDPASAQFYDPASEMWYDPAVGRWHRV